MKLAELIDLFPLGAEYEKASKSLYDLLGITVRDIEYDPDTSSISFFWSGNESWQGHPGLIHGGIIATLHDTAAGILAMVCSLQDDQVAFTKSLSIEYAQPLFVGASVRVSATIEEIQERGLLIKVVIIERDTDVIVSTARGNFRIKGFL